MPLHKLDITKEHCPMTFVKTKLRLARISTGEILEVLLKKGEPLDNVPGSVEEEGHKVLKIELVEGDIYRIVIKKK